MEEKIRCWNTKSGSFIFNEEQDLQDMRVEAFIGETHNLYAIRRLPIEEQIKLIKDIYNNLGIILSEPENEIKNI